MNRLLLDVHKIQFILNYNEDIDSLVRLCRDMALNYGLNLAKRMFKGELLGDDTNKSIAYIKRILQTDFAKDIQNHFVDMLFNERVKR